MGSICFLLIGAATAVQFGWQPIPGGGREYIVQVEPQLVDTFRKEGCSSDVPPQLRDIRKIRVVVGDGRLPHQGEMAPQSKAASGATVAKVTKTAKPVVPDNNAAKPAEKAESRLAGIGDVEDPISEASIPKLAPAKSTGGKIAGGSSDKSRAAVTAKFLAPDDVLPLPGPAVDRPDSLSAEGGASEPPLVPVQSAPSVMKSENPDRRTANDEQPTQPVAPQPSIIRSPHGSSTIAANEIHPPPLISAAAGAGATPVTETVRPTFASSPLPAANTTAWATDKPSLAASDPPADPTPDNRAPRWGNGGRAGNEATAASGGASPSDPFAAKTPHASPSEEPLDVAIGKETLRPGLRCFRPARCWPCPSRPMCTSLGSTGRCAFGTWNWSMNCTASRTQSMSRPRPTLDRRFAIVAVGTPASGECVKEWGLAPSQPRKNSNYRRVARCLSPFFHILGVCDCWPSRPVLRTGSRCLPVACRSV